MKMDLEPSTEEMKRKLAFAETGAQLQKDFLTWQWCVLHNDVSTPDLLFNLQRSMKLALDQAEALKKEVL